MFDAKLKIVLMFVDSPARSCEFYKKLLNREPLEASSTFCLFKLDNDVQLGFWSRHTALPKVTAHPGAAEISFSENDIDRLYNSLKEQKYQMAQEITDMDFGRTFVVQDPDGHPIRFYKLS